MMPSAPPPALPPAPDELERRLAEVSARVIACRACPRLVRYREQVARERRRMYRDEVYWGRPLPGFGDPMARLLLVGLAPAAHGGNRTGRMFTGDRSGDFLTAALYRAGFASSPRSVARDDGLRLTDVYMTAVVRCAPPDNRPLPEEIEACRVHLSQELALLPRVRVVLALGRIAWDGYLAWRRSERREVPHPKPVFGHGAEVSLGPDGPVLIGSYHPSQQNTQTGRLTAEMMDAVLRAARRHLDASAAGPGSAAAVPGPGA